MNDKLLERYLKLRYELDQILPNATISIFIGHFIQKPNYRLVTSVNYLKHEIPHDDIEWIDDK